MNAPETFDLFTEESTHDGAEAAQSPEGAHEQMRLREIQVFNWGTFSGYHRIPVAAEGYLLVGPSGSGKSTILDAHAALTNPPGGVAFNAAAREGERKGRDRNFATYIRGAWAQQTNESGEHAAQFLRPDTTWSAIAETYRNSAGSVVVIAQVLWIRGKGSGSADVKKVYLVLEREFDLRELKFFAENDYDVRRFKFDLKDAFVREEFSAYQERFRRLLGIKSERALKLLHRTQVSKNLGDINDFMRDFMLDPPETFELAEDLVQQFVELNEAHRLVVDARRQIETLKPAREWSLELDMERLRRNERDEIQAGLERYREQLRRDLLQASIKELQTEIDGEEQALAAKQNTERLVRDELRSLERRRDELGGGLIEDFKAKLASAEAARGERAAKRSRVAINCEEMSWAPPDTAQWFTERRDAARDFVEQSSKVAEQLSEARFTLRSKKEADEREFGAAVAEVKALERQTSNIPSKMLALRERICERLGVPTERLPFAGELIEVGAEYKQWEGAIERVLHGFALSLLVNEAHYAGVASYLNDTHTGMRVVYLRMLPHDSSNRSVSPGSLVKKLNFARRPEADWVRDELKERFDYECAETLAAFRSAKRAITREGQVKHSASRHEKDDRTRLGDDQEYVLGFNNAAKLALFKRRAQELADAIEAARVRISELQDAAGKHDAKVRACAELSNIEWSEVDVNAAVAEIQSLRNRIDRETAERPDLGVLQDDIERQERKVEAARKAVEDLAGAIKAKRILLGNLARRMSELRPELTEVDITPHQRAGLDERFERYRDGLTHENLDRASSAIDKALSAELKHLDEQALTLEYNITGCFKDFVRAWPAEASGLDAAMASAPDFMAKLERLEREGLPEFQERFHTLLRKQSEQNLTALSAQLELERKAIIDRIHLVNEGLATAPFGPGTHLKLEHKDKVLPDVVAFKQQLRQALSNMLSLDAADAEARFVVISGLVGRLAGANPADKNWKQLVLDVRQHVEFIAIELDKDGVQVEVYRSGAGKSGGQRQKLASTCLAAALRYQLAGQERSWPRFCTVFLDEAFDKADADFTTMAMNIFKTFGFQMVVATPLKSVMTLEPFIGGAGFVQIRDRKVSSVLSIEYDHEAGKLRYDSQAEDGKEATAA
ncbi:ATP-binding protein [Ideonella sp. B508-1]|uniref:ATP-binding protein n=1 Tax=Ideonella sp. B508-1 TaxID=137716 RepID=UPI00034A4EF5|nr:SbcC/MukB-like Walker B domain-containing protein [Ideonella sp. B508-1]